MGLATGGYTEAAEHVDRLRAPLYRGETLGFGVGTYPAALTVYGDGEARRALASLTVPAPPPEGCRWMVRAVDASGGLQLELSVEALHPEG